MKFMQYNRMISLVKSGIHANLQLGSKRCSALCSSQSFTFSCLRSPGWGSAESTRCVGWVSEYKCKHRNMEKKKKKRIYNLERYVFYSSSKQWNYSYLCHLHRRIKRINTIRSSVIKQLKRITVFDWVFISSSHESRNNQKKASENFIVCSNSKYS